MTAEPEDDVIELVAKVIDPDAFKPRGFSGDSDWHPDDQRLAQSRARETARAALSASGLLERERVLREALTGVDAANAGCPIRNGDRGQAMRPKCIKCGADDNQNCGPELTALTALEAAVRTALSNPLKEATDGR